MDEEILDAAVELAGEIVISDQPGQAIREARTRYGFTQTWLAPHLGVRRESLSRIESGHSKPTLDVVDRFARIIALARRVRAGAARLENTDQEAEPSAFSSLGPALGIETESTLAVAEKALESYNEKREELLENLSTTRGGTR